METLVNSGERAGIIGRLYSSATNLVAMPLWLKHPEKFLVALGYPELFKLPPTCGCDTIAWQARNAGAHPRRITSREIAACYSFRGTRIPKSSQE
jgi:hypothetical protein